jgi:hypothetical protein
VTGWAAAAVVRAGPGKAAESTRRVPPPHLMERCDLGRDQVERLQLLTRTGDLSHPFAGPACDRFTRSEPEIDPFG